MSSFKRTIVRSAVAVGFSAILLIPRVRKLRRRVALWNVIRIACLACGAALLWLGFVSNATGVNLALEIPGMALILLGALVRARPLRRAVDDVARELDALVVLNGGALIAPANGHVPAERVLQTNIFVSQRMLRVLDSGYRKLLEIPVGGIRRIAIEADSSYTSGAWRLEVAGEWGMSCFLYEGAFAEHLARIAEKTLRDVWKKGLPVLAK